MIVYSRKQGCSDRRHGERDGGNCEHRVVSLRRVGIGILSINLIYRRLFPMSSTPWNYYFLSTGADIHLCAGTTQLFLSNTFYFRNYALRTRQILFTFSLRTTQRVQTYIHISLRKKLSNLKHNLYETFQSCAQLRNFDFQIYFTFATTHYAPPKYFRLFLLRTTQSLQTYIHL